MPSSMPGVKVISICRFISQTRERLSYFAHMDWHLSGLILEEVLNPGHYNTPSCQQIEKTIQER
jgi:hypothetical protein